MQIKLSLKSQIKVERLVPASHTQSLHSTGGSPAEALVAALTALKRAKARNFVTYGTLLGWVRQGGFLNNDFDIDIAVVAGADTEAVVREMVAKGFQYAEYSENGRGIVNQKFVDHSGIQIDLYYLFREGDFHFIEYQVAGESMARSDQPVREIEEIRLDGLPVPVPIPQNPESYLAHLYGEDWRKPAASWDWVFSFPNAVVVARPQELPWLILRRALLRFPRLRAFLMSLKRRLANHRASN